MPTNGSTRDIFASESGSFEEDVEIVIASPHEQLADKETRIRHLKLYRAALSGDWSMAEDIYKKHKDDVKAMLSKEGDTAFHIAAAAEHTDFVKKLVEYIEKADLAVANYAGNTAFCLAAVSGNVELVHVMMNKMNKWDLLSKTEFDSTAYCLTAGSRNVELANVTESTNLADMKMKKNRDIAMIRGRNDMLPLYMASLFGHKDMVQYLYAATDDKSLGDNDRIELFITLISNGLYDAALDFLEKHPELVTASDGDGETALYVLARMPITNQNQLGFWKRCFDIC